VQLNDIGRKIFGEHSRLIVALVVGGLVVGLLLQLTSGSMYTASARLVLDTADPKTPSESEVIQDTARAIATSPAQVGAALKQAHVRDRDALEIARNHVSISALGTSAVLELSVSDRNRYVAAALTNALAERVIEARLAVSNGQLQQDLRGLQERIDGLNSKIAALDVQVDALAVQLARVASTGQASTLRSQHDEVLQSRDLLIQQRSVAESERLSLLATGAARPKPSIISSATVPVSADSSHLVSYVALGILLGLIVGIGCAGMIELIRPALVGGDTIARALGVPFLGSLPNEPFARAPRALHTIRARLQLASDAADIDTIGVVSVVGGMDLEHLAEVLARDVGVRVSIRQLDLAETPHGVSARLGLLTVSPSELQKAEVVEFGHLLGLTPQPVLGLITYELGSANEPHPSHEATAKDEGRLDGERRQMARPLAWLARRGLSWR
jgi:uncharacterized protein involved in exopolysaccharide biosynthesis